MYLLVVAQEGELLREAFQLAEQGAHIRLRDAGFEVEEEAELEIAAGHGAALQLGEVDAHHGNLRKQAVERAGAVRGAQHQGNLVRAVVEGEILAACPWRCR